MRWLRLCHVQDNENSTKGIKFFRKHAKTIVDWKLRRKVHNDK